MASTVGPPTRNDTASTRGGCGLVPSGCGGPGWSPLKSYRHSAESNSVRRRPTNLGKRRDQKGTTEEARLTGLLPIQGDGLSPDHRTAAPTVVHRDEHITPTRNGSALRGTSPCPTIAGRSARFRAPARHERIRGRVGAARDGRTVRGPRPRAQTPARRASVSP